jgi:hypothetical protein
METRAEKVKEQEIHRSYVMAPARGKPLITAV